MERLTEWKDDKKLLAKTKFSGDFGSANILTALAEYEDAEEQNLLVKLPVKIGSLIYKPNPITLSEIVEIKVESICITENRIDINGRTTKMKRSFFCHPSDFSKTVFLTKSEAEQKLKELKEYEADLLKKKVENLTLPV